MISSLFYRYSEDTWETASHYLEAELALFGDLPMATR